LIDEIARAGDEQPGSARYLRALARLLRAPARREGMVRPEELDDRTEAFEFGERDEVY
jgi:hypothetical protein